jgi:DNA-binding MarR family transcriptional regulator
VPTPLPDDRVDRIQEQWRRERPDLDPTPQGVIGRLHRLADRLRDELIAVYREHGLGEGDFDVLASLRRTGAPFELPAGELARHTMVTTGAMTKRIDRLEAAGLVTRTPDASDGRGRRIGLTDRGRQLIDAAFTDHIANEHRLVELLAASDRETLARILKQWLGALDDA